SLPIVPPRPARAQAMEERAQAQSAAPSQLQGEAPGGGGEELREPPEDFLEWILRGRAAGRISGRGPYVILYEEYVGREEGHEIPSDTVHLLEMILVRRYREIMGGEPKIRIVTKSEVRGGLEGQPWDVDPAHKIYRIKLGDIVEEESAGGPLDEAQRREELRKRVGMFLNRFRESYAGDLGFLILHTSSARRGLEDVLVEEIRMVMKGKLIELKAGTLGKLDLRRRYDLLCELARLTFGIDTRGLEGTSSLSDCIGQASSYWEEAVLEVLEERGSLYHYVTAEWKGESKESDDHYHMKVLVVKHLVESRGDLRELAESRNIKELRERIRTEQPVGAGDVIPDVAVDGEYYEVEELFGVGPFGGFKKVQETVEKYGGIQGRVTVVVEGLAALIHQRELRDLLGNLEDSGFGGRVRVAIPFLTREGGGWRVDLVDLEDYRRRLQDLRRRMEKATKAGDH
ncbi:MAG: hypothetical protein RXR82_08030, partial [Nitrososphaeria archaeon]